MVVFPIRHVTQNHIIIKTTVKATVMDTATASLENKPLKETEAPPDDASPGPGCDPLPAAIKRKNKKIKQITIGKFQLWLK